MSFVHWFSFLLEREETFKAILSGDDLSVAHLLDGQAAAQIDFGTVVDRHFCHSEGNRSLFRG